MFTTSANAATVIFQTVPGPPKIVSTTPQNAATGVLTTTTIRVDFDQDMNTSTLNKTNIQLIDLSTGSLVPTWTSAAATASTTSYQVTGNLALTSQRNYALILTTGVKSILNQSLDTTDPLHRSGTAFGEAWVVQFATGSTLTSPSITQTKIGNIIGTASGGQTNVPINATIEVDFVQEMNGSTITTSTVVLKKTGNSTSIPVTVVYDDIANAVIITPTSPLSYNTSYTLTLIGLQDVLGNALP